MREVEGVTLYTIQEAAEQLGVTAQTVRRYIKEELLPAKRIGRPYLISGDALRHFVGGEPVTASNGTSSSLVP